MKQKRPHNHKIPDIKVLRSLTRLLGKLHIPSCYHAYDELTPQYDDNGQRLPDKLIRKESYGFGLKESKDFVEVWFDYEYPVKEADAQPTSAPWMPYPRN